MIVRIGSVSFSLAVLTVAVVWPLRGAAAPSGMQAKEQDEGGKEKPRSHSEEEDAKKKRRAERLEEMRKRVEATKVYQIVDGKRVLLELHPEPIMRYDWQLFGVPDATLWLWVDRGRPVAAQEILFLQRGGRVRMLYATFSLSFPLLDVEWGDAQPWSTRRPGLEFQPLPDGPTPSDTAPARLRQMKQIHRRFSFYQVSFRGRTEHRLLPRPPYRYAAPDTGLVDGVIFASSAHGTNPSILLLIELRQNEGDAPAWHYGLQHLGNADVHALLDGEEVWSVTDRGWRAAPTGGDTWQIIWASTPVPEELIDDETSLD